MRGTGVLDIAQKGPDRSGTQPALLDILAFSCARLTSAGQITSEQSFAF